MGAMKKSLLFTIALMLFISIPAMAAMTVEEMTDAEYTINSGYSQTTAEDVFMMKTRANGKPIEPLYEKSQNVFAKGWRWFYSYADPAVERADRIHHDIKISPSFSDL